MKPITGADADRLFYENRQLYGTRDGLPVARAVDLFGRDAVQYVASCGKPRRDYDSFRAPGIRESYLTRRGAELAATFCNIRGEGPAGAYPDENCRILPFRTPAGAQIRDTGAADPAGRASDPAGETADADRWPDTLRAFIRAIKQ